MKIFAKKSLGQHFLNSSHVLEQIIAAAEIKTGETILEIGPGTGILTKALLTAGARVIAVEKDVRSYDFLKEMFSREIEAGSLTLFNDDILKGQTHFIPEVIKQSGVYAIVANIPYYITGAILQLFLESEPRPDRMILLVQKEVAERIVAADKKESILSVSVKAFGTPKIITKVPRGAFTPPPTVDSAVLAIRNISASSFTEKNIRLGRFFEIVRAGFAHKRKFLIRNLEEILEPEHLQNIWQELNLDPSVRAEDLTTEHWLSIAQRA